MPLVQAFQATPPRLHLSCGAADSVSIQRPHCGSVLDVRFGGKRGVAMVRRTSSFLPGFGLISLLRLCPQGDWMALS